MKLPPHKNRAVRMATLATAAIVVTTLGASAVAGARPIPHRTETGSKTPAHSSPSVVGTYRYTDTVDDTGELEFNSDQTVLFSNGCSGLWLVQKKTIAFDFDSSSCFGTNIIFTGTLSGKKLTGVGEGLSSSTVSFTWTAVKID
jgi:hypothetical protein